MSYVTIENINKSFNDQQVLHNLNLAFEEGEFVTLLGPSGCGKSTLLRILAGLTTPEAGIIKIDGKDVTNVKPKDRKVGMVFQSYALFPNMTVEENIAFGLKMQKMNKEVIAKKVSRMIELVELKGKEKAYPRELSGGQQQRVALARSLVTEPKVLLLDEPLSALDAQIRKNLQKLLRSLQQELNMTTVLVTHDQEEAMAVSDRIYILNAGHIAQEGKPHDIYTRPANEFVARFIGNYNVLTKKQISLLIKDESQFTHDLYAVRPEAFGSEFIMDGYKISGKVQNIMPLGNITRYEIVSGGVAVTVEHLHKSYEKLQENELKTLYINKEDVIPLT
ncbi:ABC transporter ATP-binding protein [Paenibacillus sediminis]|uniref:Spermidine/putrescine transport system ATP-binding protein n=1 Tax=Paenibacillus sediminis TaxID=664909 RepID=A0ABS4H2S4_9BACL|nr:ABC transporter ATP-binding protein [Paenibacillus sediminis]MBP1936834.1 putative spermidine/putrescine transport system ATP-binding protein [Paenibacillus sediminis]